MVGTGGREKSPSPSCMEGERAQKLVARPIHPGAATPVCATLRSGIPFF